MPAIYQVDVFTDKPFRGNPAAVCLLEQVREDSWMQAVASEMNLSDTAFITPLAEGFGLRWFTPATEVNLCGHATLASAHVLWEEGRLAAASEAIFHTHSGRLAARRREHGIELDFPADPTTQLEAEAGLQTILGQPIVSTHQGREDWLVELPSEEAVRDCHPDLARIASLPCRGLIITARGSGNTDFVSRFFAPAAGVDEDPVTGSAHCTLAGFWAGRLGKSTMKAWQASARGGALGVQLQGERVILTGQAVTVIRGELTI